MYGEIVHLSDYRREPLLYNKLGESDVVDGQKELAEFLRTLSAEERELAQRRLGATFDPGSPKKTGAGCCVRHHLVAMYTIGTSQ
jgi:hypothetical protein